MTREPRIGSPKYAVYTRRDLERIPELWRLGKRRLAALLAVSAVLPFRVNRYVVENLIDWSRIPGDPLYQLTFPQAGMLEERDFERMLALVESGAPESRIHETAREIQWRLNPQPAGQLDLNVPRVDGEALPGIQHKYRETVLFFPSQGQTCHAYCTYCFRWAQFVGIDELKFANRETDVLIRYLRRHPCVTDVLFTGGDPLVMKTSVLRRYIEPLLSSGLDQLTTIRIGTKAPAYWPYRFSTDPDAGDLLDLFRQVRASGRHLALMVHYSHPRELEPPPAREALGRILDTGTVVRSQAPVIRHVNDEGDSWLDLWRTQVQLGVVPYYMFVERDTGARNYFEVPLARALKIYRSASHRGSGLVRAARGPSMSASPGKINVDDVVTIGGEELFSLRFIQARDPEWAGRTFFARYDPDATWIDQLEPAFGEEEFFFEAPMRRLLESRLADLAPGGPRELAVERQVG